MLCISLAAFGQTKTDPFKFVFDGRTYSGIIDHPKDQPPTSIIILVPGDGQTNLEAGSFYRGISDRFAQMGLACCLWDKAGCGQSEGQYDQEQTVQNSAQEVLAAIAELKHQNIAGSKNIGLWGISRAGWICPLVIAEDPSIAFWISVSGVDDKDNNTYLLEKNLKIQGRTDDQVRLLISEYRAGNRIFWNGGSYEEYLNATKHISQDAYHIKLHGEQYALAAEYLKDQKTATSKYRFDDATASIILVPGFSEILKKIRCPVLALFGEKDSQVDWRKTMALYKEIIGVNPKAELTMKTFPDGNHPLMKCKTGGMNEDLGSFGWQPCDGYYDAMSKWLKDHKFVK
jgi:pimeloyl-ACP methyl ester carboxylesterase